MEKYNFKMENLLGKLTFRISIKKTIKNYMYIDQKYIYQEGY